MTSPAVGTVGWLIGDEHRDLLIGFRVHDPIPILIFFLTGRSLAVPAGESVSGSGSSTIAGNLAELWRAFKLRTVGGPTSLK
jgi:hypothetical protein